jgi:hypothetical protein
VNLDGRLLGSVRTQVIGSGCRFSGGILAFSYPARVANAGSQQHRNQRSYPYQVQEGRSAIRNIDRMHPLLPIARSIWNC